MAPRVRRAQSTEPRRCIYCLATKPVAAFNKEHIIPQAFGKFEMGKGGGPVTIGCACTDCNQRFGDTLDHLLGRLSIYGVVRLNEGLKDPAEFTPPPNLSITPTDRELPSGAELRLRPGGFDVKPSIGFAKSRDEPHVHSAPDQIPDRRAILDRFGPRPSFEVHGMTLEEVEAMSRKLGIPFIITYEVPAPLRADVTVPATMELFRAMAKIAFDYFAGIMGAGVACMSAFDGVRAFIVLGEQPGPSFVTVAKRRVFVPDAQGNPRRGHFISFNNSETGFVAQVALFSAKRFRVALAHEPLSVHVDYESGHFYDLDSRRVEPIRLPRIGGRIVKANPGEGIRLDW